MNSQLRPRQRCDRARRIARLVAPLLIAAAFSGSHSNIATGTTYNWLGNVCGFGCGFNNPNNWSPAGGPPGTGDTATIEKPDLILLTANTDPLTFLNIRGGASVYTSDKLLNVTNSVGFTEVIDNSNLIVQPTFLFSFVTETLSLRLGGELDMAGGGALATFIIRVSQTSIISGFGTVGATASAGTGLDLAGTIHPEGGDLNIVVANGANMDLDGNNSGNDYDSSLDVTADGDLILNGPLADPFSGRLDIGNNNLVQFTNPLQLDGKLNFVANTSNRLMAPTVTFKSGADVSVQGADGRIDGTTTFQSGSEVFLLNAADDLRLFGDSTVHPNVQFTGAGAVEIQSGGTMTLLDGASVGVKVNNTGASGLVIGAGSAVGAATIAAYQQSSDSLLDVDLGGLIGGDDFDQLSITGNAMLNGILQVALTGGFTLSKGVSFEIIDIAGTRTGTFNMLAEGAKVGTFGKDLFITYAGGDGNDVALFTKGFSADFDDDNDVDGADLLIWQKHLGLAAGAMSTDGDADGDHDVDDDDLAAWKAQFGSVAPIVAASTATPEPAAALLLLCGGCAIIRRGRPLRLDSRLGPLVSRP
jgi:hypothetical protein